MFISKKKGDKMNIAPVSMSNYNCSPADKKISFQAMKLGGVTVSDEAGKAINKLVETLNEIPRQRAKYIDISLGNSRAHETQFQRPYYEIKAGDMFIMPENVYHTFEYHEDTTLIGMYDNGVALDENIKDIWNE